jgi:4-amino-4-deoxy-L-arabinose transferase-like glycosyltransferase
LPEHENTKKTSLLVTGSLLALALVLWSLPFMVGHEPWNDEAYTFSLIYNVTTTGDVVVPRAGGLPFMEKPPLYYASAAASARVFDGVLPLYDGARLINIIYLVIALIALACSARRAGNRGSALASVLLFLGCLGLWEVYHRLITDVAMLSGFTLAIAGLLLARERPLYAGALLGTGAGMAFMAKGLFGLGQLGLVALLLPLCFAACNTRRYWLAMLVAVLFGLPWVLIWPLALYANSPELFHDWFWLNNIGRFTGTSGLGPREIFGFYFYAILWQAWPAIPLAAWQVYQSYRGAGARYLGVGFVVACLLTLVIVIFEISKLYALPLSLWLVLLARHSARSQGFRPGLIAYIGFAVPLLILSMASTSTDIYAIVLLPSVVLMATTGGQGFPAWLLKVLDRINVAALAVILLFILAIWVLLHAGFDNPVQRYFIGRLPAYVPDWQWSTLLLALAISAGWLLLLLKTRLSLVNLAWRWSGGIIAIGLLFDLLWRSYIALSLNHTAMIYDMEAHLPPQYNCIASFDIGESLRGMIHYRTGIVVQDWTIMGNKILSCELRLLRENQLQVVEDGDWNLVWRGSRPGDGKVYSVYQN